MDAFLFVPFVDGFGEDSGHRVNPNDPISKLCEETLASGCVAFNTLGYVKKCIWNVDIPCTWYDMSKDGLWVTKEEYATNTAFDNIKKLLAVHAIIGPNIHFGSLQDEIVEQYMAVSYITPEDVVLELGGNIGRNALVISNILRDDRNLLTLECHPKHADELKHNRDINRASFRIEPSALSSQRLVQNRWDTKPLSEGDPVLDGWFEIPTISWPALQTKYSDLNFNVLVADCEGALFHILQKEPTFLNNIKTIIFENDGNDMGARDAMPVMFAAHNFQMVYSANLRTCKNYWSVWTKKQENTVYTSFIGRAGNNFFQVALGIAYAKEHGKQLVVVDTKQSPSSPWIHADNVVSTIPCGVPVYREGEDGAYRALPHYEGDCAFYGYWQCLRYFDKYWEDVRKVLYHPNPVAAQMLISDIRSKFSEGTVFAGVHFRFGDYVQNPMHPIPTKTYYDIAVSMLPEDVVLLVYSDDMPKARANLPNHHVVHEVNEKDYDVLEIISKMCTYHVIANSSFSWWAARFSTVPPENITMPYPYVGLKKEWNQIYIPGCRVVDYNKGTIRIHE